MQKKSWKIYLSKIACVLLVCVCFSALSQTSNDTIKVAKKVSTRFLTEGDINRNIALRQLDTNSNGIEIFHNLYKNYTVFQDLGNIGTPSRALLFNPERNVGFKLCDNPFEGYWMKPENTKFYNTKTPYTDLFYAQGSNELIYLLARHSQNILPRWNVGADLQRITSIGFLAKQYTSIYNYQFFTRYVSKNLKYELIAHTTWNRGVVEESGGVASDSAFEALTGANKKVTPNFNSSQTRFKARTAYVKQYWHLGKSEEIISDVDTIYKLKSNKQISYSIKAEEVSYIFENLNGDTSSSLIPNQYYDISYPAKTLDSMYQSKLENKLAFDLFSTTDRQQKDSVRDYLGVSIMHTYNSVSQISYVRNYQNVIGDFTFERIRLKNYTWSTQMYYALNVVGFNAGDHKAKITLSYRFPLFDFGIDALQQLYKADNAYQLFKSNQFIWNNNFNRINVNQLGVRLSTRKFRNNFHVSANVYLLNNWIYVNTIAEPQQTSTAITVTTIQLNKTFQAWKFYFEHQIIYQNSSNDVIRIPELSGKIRYYFQSRFKKMKFQIGIDAFYNSAYYANNYSPATRMFFLQNDKKIGNYPLIDPFVSGEIKRATIFAKYEHVNQDWFNLNGFYYTPHYPISLASFRFGIRWRFYD